GRRSELRLARLRLLREGAIGGPRRHRGLVVLPVRLAARLPVRLLDDRDAGTELRLRAARLIDELTRGGSRAAVSLVRNTVRVGICGHGFDVSPRVGQVGGALREPLV